MVFSEKVTEEHPHSTGCKELCLRTALSHDGHMPPEMTVLPRWSTSGEKGQH